MSTSQSLGNARFAKQALGLEECMKAAQVRPYRLAKTALYRAKMVRLADGGNHRESSDSDKEFWARFDIIGKALIGVAGLSLSAVLGIIQYQNTKEDRRIKIEENRRANENSLKEEFKVYYSSARTSKVGDILAKSDIDLASSVAQVLKSSYNDSFYFDSILALKGRIMPENIKPGGPSVSGLNLQASEAASSTTVNSDDAQWFAVLGSYKPTVEGLERAKQQASGMSELGCIEIWKTHISQNYAVVLGGITSRSVALVNAQIARSDGTVPDAFVQVNREWLKVSDCPRQPA